MTGPQASLLPDGVRLHLNHGPIDLIIWVDAANRAAAHAAAVARFGHILDDLVAELPRLRRPAPVDVRGATARRMARAVLPFAAHFITPMAAVAGAVADEVLAAMLASGPLSKAWVNNGGDIALHLAPGESFVARMPHGRLTISAADLARGIATSGWRGRSQSRGIADAVTVLAADAAAADAAATMIANAVDLPGHHGITRHPATAVKADSDLGQRLVTTAVAPLAADDRATALDAGLRTAEAFRHRGLIHAAFLGLQGETRGTMPLTECLHA